MAKPSKPKDIKPKADGDAAASGGGGGGGGLDLKFIITLMVIMLCTTLTSGAAVYFLAPMVLMPAIEEQLKKVAAAPAHGEEGAEGEGEHETSKVGMNLELDEFTVNLKEDPALPGTQYLRAKMSLNVGVPAEEDCYAEPAEGEKHAEVPAILREGQVVGAAVSISSRDIDDSLIANGGGAAVDPKVACIATFKDHMGKYIPTIRDVINASLMKRSAGTLATLEGQEALKDEIKESINQFMGEKYQIIRVNFEDFIIQK